MFDYHMHSSVSFDSVCSARDMLAAAEKAGLKEICFTDHMDYNNDLNDTSMTFTPEQYSAAYDSLTSDMLLIRRGVEFGLTLTNREVMERDLKKRNYDFVLGSIHFVNGLDPYYEEFWAGKTVKQAFRNYLDETLACVKIHDNYDVLGHLTYVCKSTFNPTHEPVLYAEYQEVAQEIMRILVQKGKGMEINTSGVDAAGAYLPSAEYLRRFKELGGEIVTVGSDAHNAARVGQYTHEAAEILKDIFGYVCTFEGRKPIFHKL